MDIFLFILSITFMIVGIIGSIVPVLPGPLSSWLGLFIFSNIKVVEVNNSIIVLTLIIAITIFILDYVIPLYTSKKFGASKFGIIGASIGIIIGLFLPPLGIIFGAIIGAISGELFLNKDFERSIKAAAGVVIGLAISGLTKAVISVVFFVIYIYLFINNLPNLF
mgnify:FL=1